MKLLFVSALLVAVFAACYHPADENVMVKETVSNSTKIADAQTDSSNQASRNAAAIKTGRSTGIVTKVNLEIGSVELKHDEIKGMMPAMQMEFYVTNKTELENLKIGDKVDFTLQENQGAESITKISKSE